MKKILVLLFVAVFAMNAGAQKGEYSYQTVKNDPLNARIYTLDNGLKVYLTVNKEQPRIQTYIAVRVGGKNDPAETTGLAHYFEHLMFKGTPSFGTQNYEAEKPLLNQIEQLFEQYRVETDEAKRKEIYAQIDQISYEASGYAIPNEYDKLMAAIGASGTNAYTGYDQTVYVEDIPSNQVENYLKIQSDRFQNPVIRGFHTELETIYEEKNMSLTSDGRKVLERTLSTLFPTHPYGTQTVLGTQEHLKNPSITNVRNYHATWYVPNNMAVCMSGDFDMDETIALVDKYFGGMKPNKNLPTNIGRALPTIHQPIVSEVVGLDAENVTVAWRTGGSNSDDADIMNILSGILYNGQAGLVDLDLVQQQKVLSAYGFYYNFADHGMLLMQGRPKEGQTLDQVRELLIAQVDKLRKGDFDEKLITATVNNYKAQQQRYYDSNGGRADAFVTSFIEDIPWEKMVTQLDRIGKITKEQVVKFARERFRDDNYAVVYKREGKDPNELTIEKPALTPIQTNRDAASAFVTAIQNSKVEPIEPVFLDFDKDMSRLKGKSGVEVLYKENTTTDLFELEYIFEVGNNNDPTVSLASRYLEYLGTADMTAEQLAAEFYAIACSWRVSVAEDRTHVAISGLSENMTRAMELTEKLLNGAVANEAILEGLKGDMMKSRADSKLNQSANFSRLLTYAQRGPEYIKGTTLTNEQLAAITSEELLGKLKNFRTQQHRVLYYGPKSEKEVLRDIVNCHDIVATLVPVGSKVEYPYPVTDGSSVLLAEYDAAQIYYFQSSNRGEKYDVKNDAPVALYNSYFGGGMSSIVFQEMREARGLAYMAQAFLSQPMKVYRPYMYGAIIATQNDKLKDAALAFDDIINNMPQSEAAFAIAKESLMAELRTERIIKAGILWEWIEAQDMGLDYDRRRDVFEKLPAMTLGDVTAFQQKWIRGRDYTFSILGRSADLDQEFLKTLGPVRKVSLEEIFGY